MVFDEGSLSTLDTLNVEGDIVGQGSMLFDVLQH